MGGYCVENFRIELVEFLVLVENDLDTLGDDPVAQQEAANQLSYDLLVEPAKH